MPIKINADDLLKIAKDNTFQKSLAVLFALALSFFAGRVTATKCDQSIICADIIKDRELISTQLSNQYKNCQIEKEKEMKTLAEDLNQHCAERVSEALVDCRFDEELHCPICMARGICKP